MELRSGIHICTRENKKEQCEHIMLSVDAKLSECQLCHKYNIHKMIKILSINEESLLFASTNSIKIHVDIRTKRYYRKDNIIYQN